MNDPQAIQNAAEQFSLGEFIQATPHGNGHINDSYLVEFSHEGAPVRAILQRINTNIFTNPAALMENIERVCNHLAAKNDSADRATRSILQLHRTRDGLSYFLDPAGNYWRAYQFIDGARSFDRVENNSQAFEAGRAFGQFQRQLADLPAPRLQDTIPGFHYAPTRLGNLKKAISEDLVNRVKESQLEIDFVFKRLKLIRSLIDANLPERITHNDCKLNNVLIDDETGTGLCVIDLDTVMPGLLPFDFGDMVRTIPCSSNEDEQNLSKVKLNFKTFSALSRGYLSAVTGFITDEEKSLLVTGGMLITFLIGIRFLTDHLSGDHYFKIHRAGHNLDRCRVQFKLLESIEEQKTKLEDLIASI